MISLRKSRLFTTANCLKFTTDLFNDSQSAVCSRRTLCVSSNILNRIILESPRAELLILPDRRRSFVLSPTRSFCSDKGSTKLTAEHVQQLNNIKALVASLHASLNVDEQCLRTERELVAKLETVRQALEPLEKQKQQLVLECDKRTNRILWVGLALMGIQLGAFARLTWFEYSWDIMEPVTYFATYTAVIGGYAYFAATRMQYEYPDAKERIALNKFYKLCRKKGFDVEKYNSAKETLYELEKDLERLRRQPTFASYRSTPLMEHTITVIRDAKSTSQSTGSRVGQESVAESKSDISDSKGGPS